MRWYYTKLYVSVLLLLLGAYYAITSQVVDAIFMGVCFLILNSKK